MMHKKLRLQSLCRSQFLCLLLLLFKRKKNWLHHMQTAKRYNLSYDFFPYDCFSFDFLFKSTFITKEFDAECYATLRYRAIVNYVLEYIHLRSQLSLQVIEQIHFRYLLTKKLEKKSWFHFNEIHKIHRTMTSSKWTVMPSLCFVERKIVIKSFKVFFFGTLITSLIFKLKFNWNILGIFHSAAR